MTKINLIILILIIFFCTSCTKIISSTRNEHHEFRIDNGCVIDSPRVEGDIYVDSDLKRFWGENNYFFYKESDTAVKILLRPRNKKYKQLSKIHALRTHKNRYSYLFRIQGNFEKIEKLDAYFIYNNTHKIEIPIKAKDLFRVEADKPSERYYHDISPPLPHFSNRVRKSTLPIKWDETKSLYAIVNFTGTKKGKIIDYNLKCSFEKKIRIDEYNDFWAGIMGI